MVEGAICRVLHHVSMPYQHSEYLTARARINRISVLFSILMVAFLGTFTAIQVEDNVATLSSEPCLGEKPQGT